MKRSIQKFNYSDLSELEKAIILVLGDDIKFTPDLIFDTEDDKFNMKFANKIHGFIVEYNAMLDKEDKIIKEDILSKEEFGKVLKKLCLKGLIVFTEEEVSFFKTTTFKEKRGQNKEKKLKNHYEDMKVNFFPPEIRLTNQSETTLSGKYVYYHLLCEENYKELEHEINNLKDETNKKINRKIDKNIKNVKEKMNKFDKELNKKIEKLESNLNNYYNKIIQVIAVFIAIFTLIVGNIGVLNFIGGKNLVEVISLVLIINGTILFSICYLVILLNMFILSINFKGQNLILTIILPIILIIMGIIIKFLDIFEFIL